MTLKQLGEMETKATFAEVRRAYSLEKFFPSLNRGHGHKRGPDAQPPVCRMEGCVRENKQGKLEYSSDHIQGGYPTALANILDIRRNQTREA